MGLSPLLCGAWDGCSAFVSWNPSGTAGTLLRVRVRQPGGEWGAWRNVGRVHTRGWAVVQMTREGWELQAQAAPASVLKPLESAWETAAEVTFARSRCAFRFELSPAAKAVRIPAGTMISAMVDMAACAYVTQEEILLQPGEGVQTEMNAAQPGAWAQIDAPGDFTDRSAFPGLTVFNATPSTNDTEPTGRDFTVLAHTHPGGPFAVAKTGRRASSQ